MRGCDRNQKRCREAIFDQDEFLGKHQWHWLHKAKLGSETITPSVEMNPSPAQSLGMVLCCEVWGDFTYVKSFFVHRMHEEAVVAYEGWREDLQQVVRLSPALGAAALEIGNCCKLSPWALYQTLFHCEWSFLLELDLNMQCWDNHSPELSHPEAICPHSQWPLWTEKAPMQPTQVFLQPEYSHALSIIRGSRCFSSDAFSLGLLKEVTLEESPDSSSWECQVRHKL